MIPLELAIANLLYVTLHKLSAEIGGKLETVAVYALEGQNTGEFARRDVTIRDLTCNALPFEQI